MVTRNDVTYVTYRHLHIMLKSFQFYFGYFLIFPLIILLFRVVLLAAVAKIDQEKIIIFIYYVYTLGDYKYMSRFIYTIVYGPLKVIIDLYLMKLWVRDLNRTTKLLDFYVQIS